MARVRVLAVWLVGSGCFSDNGLPPQEGGSSGETASAPVTTTEGSPSTSSGSEASGAQTSGEASSGGAEATTMDPGTAETTSPETEEPSPAGCPADTALLACYRFETVGETTPDESPYAHAAKVALATQAAGLSGMGLDVTAMSQVQATDADHLTPGESISLSLWFNARTLPMADGYRMVLLDKDSEYGVIIRPAGIGCSFSSGIPQVQVPVTVNKWTHVACVHTPEGISGLYIDGVPIGMEETGPLEMIDVNGPLAIGNDSPVAKTTDGFDGVIDEIKIWGRALTLEEIQAQANP